MKSEVRLGSAAFSSRPRPNTHRPSDSSVRAWSDSGEEITEEEDDFSFFTEPALFPDALYLGEPLDLRDEGDPLELPRSGEA